MPLEVTRARGFGSERLPPDRQLLPGVYAVPPLPDQQPARQNGALPEATRARITSMIALYYAFYNFCRVHQTLKTTPAVAAGVADHVWTLTELDSN